MAAVGLILRDEVFDPAPVLRAVEIRGALGWPWITALDACGLSGGVDGPADQRLTRKRFDVFAWDALGATARGDEGQEVHLTRQDRALRLSTLPQAGLACVDLDQVFVLGGPSSPFGAGCCPV